MTSEGKPIYTVRVRDLVEFVLRRGDLGGARDFVGSDRALAGTRGHQKLQRSRPAGYQKELRLRHDVDTEDFILRIQGRLDGLLEGPEETLLEEIKTTQGAWNRRADPLHWAQAKYYGYFYCQRRGLEQITLQLTYLDLDNGKTTEFKERLTVGELQGFFEATAAVYIEWIKDRHRWCRQRDESIRSLAFPFVNYRAGQRELAIGAYRVLAKGGALFLEAPTGIGKTISVLFPAVKAMGEARLERVFYLTARTVGRAIAEKAFADMRSRGLRLRSLTLTAKEKLCVRDGKPCEASTCPLALGYYDRHKPAMRAALQYEEITRPVLEAVANEHQVCPFELSLDVSTWVDAVICDYNYVFDPSVYLRRHFAEDRGDFGFLVDEAHNLVDRAREMFSADLDAAEIEETKRAITGVPRCVKALGKLGSALRKLSSATASPASAEPPSLRGELNLYPAESVVSLSRAAAPAEQRDTQTRRELPEQLLPLVEQALAEAEVWLVQNEPAEFREKLLSLYFRLHTFRRTAEIYDARFVTIINRRPAVRVRLFCLDPSFLLGQAVARGKAAVFFSATLRPLEYYRSLLGGGAEAPVLQLTSPFPPGNLQVLVHDGVQTHFRARETSLTQVALAIGALVEQKRGNYLVYFPSFKYLVAVLERFQALHPAVEIMAQQPGMTEEERECFIAAFRTERSSALLGFAVMGGVFGEGIDLVGEHLIGAVIVGVGLPQLCVERDLIRDYFQELNGDGFSYAYTFPGMNRVLQAIGRVIRSEADRGVVLLLDQRFRETRYRKLFPAWWQVKRVRSAEAIARAARQFWLGPAQAPEPEPEA